MQELNGNALCNRSISIFGLNYWPEETGNAPYSTGLAEHLATLGAVVTVYAGFPYYPEWRVDDSYGHRLRLTEHRNGVKIRRFRQYVPTRQSALRRAGFESTFLLNAALTRQSRPVDAIVGILPALADGVLAKLASRITGAPYGMLIQDLVGQSAAQSGIAGGGRVAGTTARIEMGTLADASRIAVVSEGFIPPLTRSGIERHKIDLVPNWSHVLPLTTDSRAEQRRLLGWSENQFIVLHAGNMGLKQGLENVVEAARIAAQRNLPIQFVLMGDGNQRTHLEQLAAGLATISFRDPVPRDVFTNVLAAADVLLVNERDSVHDMSLPSKLTSYYVAGRPIVAAVSPQGVTASEIRRSGAGFVVSHGDPAGLIAGIEHLQRNTSDASRFAAAGPGYATSHLSMDVCLERAAAFVERIILA